MPDTKQYWSQIFEEIVHYKKTVHRESYNEDLGKYIEVTTYLSESDKLICVIKDISKRKSQEFEINFKNTLLTTQLECTLDGILIVDESGKILYFNSKFRKIWNIPDYLIEKRVDEPVLLHVVNQVKDPGTFLSRVRYLYTHINERSFEELHLLDGRILERYSTPIHSDEGEYFGRVWYFREIRERIHTESALRESEEKFRSLVENALEGILILDNDGSVIFANHTAARILGPVHANHLIGSQIDKYIGNNSLKSTIVNGMSVLNSSQPIIQQYSSKSSEGKILSLESIR